MLASADTFAAVALAIVAIVFLLGIGAFVGSLAGRRAVQNANEATSKGRMPEQAIRELEQCVELGDCISRDADSVTALLSAEASAVPPELAEAMQQLIKSTKSLSGRLQRVDESTSPGDMGAVTPPAQRAAIPPPAPKPAAKPVAKPVVVEAPEPEPAESNPPEHAESEEARRFPRSPCHGNLKATIYPPPSSPGGAPVHCTVLTRDLSCGGIGIAHAEQLFPRQIVVLDAVGKLLVGEVRWCRQLDERFYIAGCRLVKTSD